jgi:hypothetical protein
MASRNTAPPSPPAPTTALASGPTHSSAAPTSRVVGPSATLRDDGAAAHSHGLTAQLAGSPDGSAGARGTSAGVIANPVALLAAEPCAGSASGPDAASIEWLPGEVLALVFGFVGAKALTATIPAVSPCRVWVSGQVGGWVEGRSGVGDDVMWEERNGGEGVVHVLPCADIRVRLVVVP